MIKYINSLFFTVYMKRIDYSKLYRGNVIVMPVNPAISNEKNYAVVSGIVGSINNEKLMLANGADIRSSLDNKLAYKKNQIDTDNIRLVIESLRDKTLCFDQTPKIGDLIMSNDSNENYYVGFVNEINGNGLLLSNYHPKYRTPWIKKNESLMNLGDGYIKLLTNDDILNTF